MLALARNNRANTYWLLSGAGLTLDKPKSAAPSRNKDKKITSVANPHPRADSPPGWANGLRQLYDAVVEEPLPDTFKDLLSKLDNKS